MGYIKGLKCRECGREYAVEPIYVCEFCFGPLEVAYDYAAAQRHITDRQNGLIVPYKAEELFIEHALALVNSDINLTEIRQNARNYALSIDWFQIIERFEKILRENCNTQQALS